MWCFSCGTHTCILCKIPCTRCCGRELDMIMLATVGGL